jgi:phenylalanyl-tRNA synthetase alpha chain
MKKRVETLKESFLSDIKECLSINQVQDLRVRYLGKKGQVMLLMQDLKTLSKDERPKAGQLINSLKVDITEKIEALCFNLEQQEMQSSFASEKIDISLPAERQNIGSSHPLTQMLDRSVDILSQMGFSVFETPEIESEYHNYGGLNYPDDHPARDMQDTYYIDKETLLRSHTTSFQQRVMQEHNPPIRMISLGKCFRNETISSRSHVIFHQIDGMAIDKGLSFRDLLATLTEFYSRLFAKQVKLRTRPSYFPFVEPGMEVDISCTLCDQKGCSLCKKTGWLEVAGAGMIHPEVLKEGGIDPDEYNGFAWGGGVERVYQLLHGVNDIRLFMENDLRFLKQF